MKLAYCDFIAHKIHKALWSLGSEDPTTLVAGNIKYDLHPTEGYMLSTKKTIRVADENGKEYLVTVEEITD